MKFILCAAFASLLSVATVAVEVDMASLKEHHEQSTAEKGTGTNGDAAVAPPRYLKKAWVKNSSVPYQADPKFTRPSLVGAHSKWLWCSSAFWVLENGQCEAQQNFVPPGYWFETGRPMPTGTDCSALTGNGDIPIANCNVKKGLKMVLPVVNTIYIACDDNGMLEDPRLGVATVSSSVCALTIHKATLDGVDVNSLDAVTVLTQDGDGDYRMPTVNDACRDEFDLLETLGGCPLYSGGPYVFIDTKRLAKGQHELVLIGEDTSVGFCSAVKHVFTLY